MDLALSVLTAKPDDKHKKLVGRAMECATSMGEWCNYRKVGGGGAGLTDSGISVGKEVGASNSDWMYASYFLVDICRRCHETSAHFNNDSEPDECSRRYSSELSHGRFVQSAMVGKA